MLPLLLLGAALVGPVSRAEKPPVELEQAREEIPSDLLLDVNILIFDPGLPEEDENGLEAQGVYADVRRAESRYVAFQLKDTLESTGYWGAVRVVPHGSANAGVTVSGQILQSTGLLLAANVRVEDAAGHTWFERRYKAEADVLDYAEDRFEARDPFQEWYDRVANDLLAARERLSDDEVRALREVSRLRFAADLAPAAFGDYVSVDRKGRYEVERLPAVEDPMLDRVARVRQRDEAFVDTLNEYYAELYRRMADPYDQWRRYSFDEQSALRDIRRDARMKKILGGLLLLGSAVTDGGSTASRVARDAAAIGGALVLHDGIEQGKEAKIHREALKELAASFDAEITPVLVESEGQRLRLEGSAEAQFEEWRRLLGEIFTTETGLPAEPGGAVSPDETGTAGR